VKEALFEVSRRKYFVLAYKESKGKWTSRPSSVLLLSLSPIKKESPRKKFQGRY
jgi:hypothetical protein